MGTGLIVKVQRSIVTNSPVERVLIYNKDRTIMKEFDMTEEVKKLFLPHEFRLYFEASFQNGILTLDTNLPEQDF